MTGKMVNVKNNAKVSHTNISILKSTMGNQKNLQFWQQLRNTLLTKSLITVIYFAWYYTPLKNFMDNPPYHNNNKKCTPSCLFSHNKGMNTMICVLLHHCSFIKLKEATSLHPSASSGIKRVSWTPCLTYTARGVRLYVDLVDAHVTLSDAFMLTCNSIHNGFTEIPGVWRNLPRSS